eukprot:969909_1
MAAPAEHPSVLVVRAKCAGHKKDLARDASKGVTAEQMKFMHTKLIALRNYWLKHAVEIYDNLSRDDYMELANECGIPPGILTQSHRKYVSTKGGDVSPSKQGESCQDSLCNDLCFCEPSTRTCMEHDRADYLIHMMLIKFQVACVKLSVISLDETIEWWDPFLDILTDHFKLEWADEIPLFLNRLRTMMLTYKHAENDGKLADSAVIKDLQGQMDVAYTGVVDTGNIDGRVTLAFKKAKKREWVKKSTGIIYNPGQEGGIWMRVLDSMNKLITQAVFQDVEIGSDKIKSFYENFNGIDPGDILSKAEKAKRERDWKARVDAGELRGRSGGMTGLVRPAAEDISTRTIHANSEYYNELDDSFRYPHHSHLPFDDRNHYQPFISDEYNDVSGSESSLLIGGVVGASGIVIIMLIFCLGLAFGMVICWGCSQQRALDV